MDRLSSLPALWHRSWNFPHTLPREHPEMLRFHVSGTPHGIFPEIFSIYGIFFFGKPVAVFFESVDSSLLAGAGAAGAQGKVIASVRIGQMPSAVWRFKGGKKSCFVFQFSVGISAPAIPGREWVSGRTEILVHGFPEFVETGNFSGP